MTAKKYKKTFVVDRETWIRGYDPGGSCLVREDGHKCCLGFYLQACGMRTKDMRDMAMPSGLDKDYPLPKQTEWLLEDINDWNKKQDPLMSVNDEARFTDAEIESKLKKMFAEEGILIKFRGKRRSTKATQKEI